METFGQRLEHALFGFSLSARSLGWGVASVSPQPAFLQANQLENWRCKMSPQRMSASCASVRW